MTKLRKWLIERLGGVVKEGRWCTFQSDYWKDECVRTTIYVPNELYNDATTPDIERELVEKLSRELLRRDLLCFCDASVPDSNGDIWISCQANVLKFKKRERFHMLSRLSDVRERRRRNE